MQRLSRRLSSTMASQYSLQSTIKLNNGIEMPRIHLGVYMTKGQETENAVQIALENGYRGVDSAEWYGNEKEVGNPIQKFLQSPKNVNLGRKDIWFTTKLMANNGYDQTRQAIKKSLKQSGLGYIDLYLLHSPYGGKRKRLDCWKGVEDAVLDGEVMAAGVSNFGVKQLKELMDSKPRIKPAVNQVEVHPFNTRTDIKAFCKFHDIVVEAYAPLAKGMRMKHPVIGDLCKKYGCTPAQLMIRWSLQHEYVPLPKSVTEERIISNGKIDWFQIDENDMKLMDSLDEHLVTDWDPTTAD